MIEDGALRVVHVCCTAAFAGVERHVSELSAAQAAAGHQVSIVGGDLRRMAAVAGPGVQVAPGHGIADALRSLRRLHRRTGPPDVMNVHLTAAEIVAGLVWWWPRVPVVSTRHIATARGSRPLTRPVVRLAARRVDAQIAVSQFVADRVDGPSTVVLSGVRPDPGRVPAPERRRAILVAQRMEPEKETDVAVRAFARSGLALEGWRLEIAGTGSLQRELRALTGSLGIGHAVDFLGHRSDLASLMRSSAALLAPDSDEAFGLTVAEAMAHGLPVVASGAGAHLETVGSVPDAMLHEPGDAADAARVLCTLVSSEPLRDEYGARLQAAQRERFTVERQARRTEAVYRGVL